MSFPERMAIGRRAERPRAASAWPIRRAWARAPAQVSAVQLPSVARAARKVSSGFSRAQRSMGTVIVAGWGPRGNGERT
jgi:hypothetical protein